MRTWVVHYFRNYDPGLVLTCTVLAHTAGGAILRAAAVHDFPEWHVTAVIQCPQ